MDTPRVPAYPGPASTIAKSQSLEASAADGVARVEGQVGKPEAADVRPLRFT